MVTSLHLGLRYFQMPTGAVYKVQPPLPGSYSSPALTVPMDLPTQQHQINRAFQQPDPHLFMSSAIRKISHLRVVPECGIFLHVNARIIPIPSDLRFCRLLTRMLLRGRPAKCLNTFQMRLTGLTPPASESAAKQLNGGSINNAASLCELGAWN